MQGYEQPVEIKVWGNFACFTRPEMKVERVTYPVMTPSAARGVLEAVFWRPEFAWQVREIIALRRPAYYSIVRNEVKKRASDATARGWERSGGQGGFAVTEERTQRHTLALRGVEYIIRADIALRPDVRDDPAKYRDQFRRRVERGQCAHTPYLGCREFAASFARVEAGDVPEDGHEWSEPLGRMLLDLAYEPGKSGRGVPRFFDAVIERNVLRVPTRPLAWEVA